MKRRSRNLPTESAAAGWPDPDAVRSASIDVLRAVMKYMDNPARFRVSTASRLELSGPEGFCRLVADDG